MEAVEKKKRGRPKLEITDKDKQQVSVLAGLGLTRDQIALVMGMSDESVGKYFRRELEEGVAKANAKVAQNLFSIATSREQGSVAAAIFWMKSRARWRETTHIEHLHAADENYVDALRMVANRMRPTQNDPLIGGIKPAGRVIDVSDQASQDAAVARKLAKDGQKAAEILGISSVSGDEDNQNKSKG
jgi:hypothetical protein